MDNSHGWFGNIMKYDRRQSGFDPPPRGFETPVQIRKRIWLDLPVPYPLADLDPPSQIWTPHKRFLFANLF